MENIFGRLNVYKLARAAYETSTDVRTTFTIHFNINEMSFSLNVYNNFMLDKFI